MNYGDDFYKDTPVLTVNNFNKGKAYYIGTDASQEFYDDFIKLVLDKNFIEKDVNLELPIGIEVTTRYNEKQKYIFVQNFNRHEVELNDMETLGERILGKSSTKIDAYETIVFKQ
jgi:beta-galactosidase